ncbi:MAG TPA: DNA-binding protein [Blastocatellia bacterium]|nr:DNA-binding protein [Blastocatellia bacterium]
MKTIEVTLPEQVFIQLEEMARAQGLTTQELLQISVEEKLARAREDSEFRRMAEYIVEKNEDLYRRLA